MSYGRDGISSLLRGRVVAAGIALLAIVVALLATPFGGSSKAATTKRAASAAAKPVQIAFFNLAFINPYEQAHQAGILSEAKKLGVTVKAFDGGNSGSTQYSQMETAIASGQYQGFIVDPASSQVFSAITDASKHHIKVYCALLVCGSNPANTTKLQVPGETGFAGVNEADSGRFQAQIFGKVCKGVSNCQVAYAQGSPSDPTDEARTAELKQALKKYPNVQLVAVINGDYDRDTTYQAAQDVFSAHPHLKAFGAGADQMAFGVQEAAQKAGVHVAILGNAGSKEGVAAVCKKQWYSDGVDAPVTAGADTVQQLVKAIRGQKYQAIINPRALVGYDFVTQANACKFKAQWSAFGK